MGDDRDPHGAGVVRALGHRGPREIAVGHQDGLLADDLLVAAAGGDRQHGRQGEHERDGADGDAAGQ